MKKTIKVIIRGVFIPIIIPISVIAATIGLVGLACNAIYEATCGWVDDLSDKL